MEIQKVKNSENSYDIWLKKDNKELKIMYGGTLKGTVYRKDPVTMIPTLWTNITMNFIEKRR